MGLPAATPAPLFSAISPVNPKFAFGSVGGRYVLLAFLPPPSPERDAALAQIAAHRDRLRDDEVLAFGVLPDEASFRRVADAANGLRWFGDWKGEIRRLYGAAGADGQVRPEWVLIDPSLRILTGGPLADIAAAFAALRALGPAEGHAGAPVHAPVLIVPRVLEPGFCRELIALYDQIGGTPSGVMRQIGGKTVGVLDDFKSRSDATIPEGSLVEGLRSRIAARLAPEIMKAFQFRVTRIERFIVACYDAQDGGYFRPHRDNTTPATAHRKFAVSINLNAEEFEGGDLRFPEFGSRTYRPPTGGAVVFSCSLLHEATPVTRGRRYATLPFLYDEEGARIRAAHASSLAVGAAQA